MTPAEKKIAREKVAVELRDGVVVVELLIGDPYKARVLYEDLTDRFRRGESVAIMFGGPNE